MPLPPCLPASYSLIEIYMHNLTDLLVKPVASSDAAAGAKLAIREDSERRTFVDGATEHTAQDGGLGGVG